MRNEEKEDREVVERVKKKLREGENGEDEVEAKSVSGPSLEKGVIIGSMREDDPRALEWIAEIGGSGHDCVLHPNRWYYVEEKKVNRIKN